jgi:hypothetical protein
MKVTLHREAKGAKGSLYYTDDEAIEKLKGLVAYLQEEFKWPEPEAEPWEQVAEEDLGRVVKGGRFMRCPIHKGGAERTPSLNLRSADEKHGAIGYCFACRDTVLRWKRDHEGRVLIQRFKRTRTKSAPKADEAPSEGDLSEGHPEEKLEEKLEERGDEFEFVAPEAKHAPSTEVIRRAWEAVTAAPRWSVLAFFSRLRHAKSAPMVGFGPQMSEVLEDVSNVIRARSMGLVRLTLKDCPYQRYASHVDVASQISATWKKSASFGANENSDKYLSMAAEVESLCQHHRRRRRSSPFPDEFMSIHYQEPADMRAVHTKNGIVYVPTDFRVVGSEWTLLDLDGLDRRSYDPLSEEGKEIESKLIAGLRESLRLSPYSFMFSGRMCVVETSKRGLQVALHLSRPLISGDAVRAFYAGPIPSALQALGGDFVRVVGRGGYSDPAVHTAGRNLRLCAPRVDKEGNFFVARPLVLDLPEA